MIADKPAVVAAALGELRKEMARRMNMIDESKFAFTWVVDFPMFEYSEEEKRYVAMHHPFTAIRDEDLDKLETDPAHSMLRHTTSFSTASNWVAAPSVFTSLICSSAYLRLSALRRKKQNRNSASCSGPSNTALPLTEAWPSAWTA